MAPLNAIPSGDASPSHSSGGPPPNHLVNATMPRNDRREDRQRRTNARRAHRKFLVYPTDQLQMLSNGTNGIKLDKMKKNGTRRRTNGINCESKVEELRRNDNGMKWEKGAKTEQNGMVNNNGMRTELDGAEKKNGTSTELDRTTNERAKTEWHRTEKKNGMRTVLDGLEKVNGTRTEWDGAAMNGTRIEWDRTVEKNGTWKRLGKEKKRRNSGKTAEEEKERMREKMERDDEKSKQNSSMRSSETNAFDQLSKDGLRNGTTDELSTTIRLDNNGTDLERPLDTAEQKQYSVTDKLLTEEDAFESEVDGQCCSSLCSRTDGPLLQNGHKINRLSEMASSSLLRISDEEEAEQEQKQQQHHHQPIFSLPRAVFPSVFFTTAAKSTGYADEILKRRQCVHSAQFVEMPSVAKPWGTTAPERLGIRRSKVIMLGDSGVGKTSIVFSHKYGPSPALLTSSPCNATIGASYTNFNMSVFDGVHVQLQIWDTAGQERFRCMVPLYMRNASAAILVYDITNRDSFEQIGQWHNEVLRCPTAVEEPVIVLIGNKADQQGENRTVAEGEGVEKALRLNAHFFEVSAVDSEVIRSIFKLVAEKIVLQCANVESAREADEAMFAEGQNERTAPSAEGQKRDDRSPLPKLVAMGGQEEDGRFRSTVTIDENGGQLLFGTVAQGTAQTMRVRYKGDE